MQIGLQGPLLRAQDARSGSVSGVWSASSLEAPPPLQCCLIFRSMITRSSCQHCPRFAFPLYSVAQSCAYA